MGTIEKLKRFAGSGASLVMVIASIFFGTAMVANMARHQAEVYQYFLVTVFLVLQGLCVWSESIHRFGYHLLRFPFAFWFTLLFFMLDVSNRHFEPNLLVWNATLFCPIWIAGIYSLWQIQKPNGKQLDLPVGIVHGFKRLGWRWMTKPRWDFWLVWVGLLASPLIGIYCFVKAWNFGEGSAFAYLLRIYALFWFAVFGYQWLLAPGRREEFKMVYLAAAHTRVLGILYLSVFAPSTHNLQDRIWSFLFVVWVTSIFEAAYDRCCRRQTQEGVFEYEALEGPSVGL